MDIALVLTHRCNLACDYCYAGTHYRREMTTQVTDRAIDLLFADDAADVVLSFFGGEPFLAFEPMRRAVERAAERAEARGRRLALQCTTNGTRLGAEQIAFIRDSGMHITLSIDGVREAHDAHRRTAGGRSSFDDVAAALRALVAAGAAPEAMLVITPETASFAFRSVRWLWDEGVQTVRANVELRSGWSAADRAELKAELTAIGRELLARRLRGDMVRFTPFEAGMKAHAAQVSPTTRREHSTSAAPVNCSGTHDGDKRRQLVVATGGNLYPCAPMVGEDRDDGTEAALRIGSVFDSPQAIISRIATKGTACADGGGCACAALLETGARETGGPIGLWNARVCAEIGRATAAALDCHEVRRALDAGLLEDRDDERTRPKRKRRRRWHLALGATAGAVIGGGWLAWQSMVRTTMGALAPPPPPDPATIEVQARGELAAPPQTPPPPMIDGELSSPPEVKVVPTPVKPAPRPRAIPGGMGPPPEVEAKVKPTPPAPKPEPEVMVLGDLG